MTSTSPSVPSELDDELVVKVPPMGAALSVALDNVSPVKMRNPKRELALFLTLSVPFLIMLLVVMGTRQDLSHLSPLWMGGVALVWLASYGASAYVGFVPAKGHVAPQSRKIWQIVLASSLVLVVTGLFATQSVESSMTYETSFDNVMAHAGGCSLMGFGTAIIPGLLALLLMRRFVPVGRASIGLSLGAAGGSLAGLALLLHCSISERFHVGVIHGGAIITAAIFVAGASRLMLRERSDSE